LKRLQIAEQTVPDRLDPASLLGSLLHQSDVLPCDADRLVADRVPLDERLGQRPDPRIMQCAQAGALDDLRLLCPRLAILPDSGHQRRVQAHVDVDWRRVDILPARRGDRSVGQHDDRDSQVVADAEKQAQVGRLHVVRNRDGDPVAPTARGIPQLLHLPADEVGRGQVPETIVRKRIGRQVGPVVGVNAPRLDTGVRVGLVAGRQTVFVDQRESRLAIHDTVIVESRDTGVVDVESEECHVRSRVSRPSCAGSA